MGIRAAIQRQGFRKWYERELMRGHAHLLLLLAATIGVIGTLELLGTSGQRGAWAWWVFCLVASTAIGIWALRRYLFLLARAEHVANQAACPACRAYGRWVVVVPASEGSSRCAGDDDDAPDSLQVHCRDCAHGWSIRF